MASIVLFSINAWVVWRLFFVDYIDQLRSVEGEFIAMARYIQSHAAGYHWQSLWYGGFPATRFYQPLAHYAVAELSTLAGRSPARAFHFVGAIAYVLGGVAFYFFLKSLSGSRVTAFCGALVFSLFSLSSAFVPGIRQDAGGIWHARRLQVLVVYGELPNVTGLMFGMVALAFLHQAIGRRRWWAVPAAAVFTAAVVATNWPATIAIAAGFLAYGAAMSWDEIREGWSRLAAVIFATTALALPFALPSTIFSTFANASTIYGTPAQAHRRWMSQVLLVCVLFLVRYLLIHWRLELPVRFVCLWAVILGWVVFSVLLAGVEIIPQALRFHVAMEIPLSVLAAFVGLYICRRWPKTRWILGIIFALFCCFQAVHYRRHARSIIHKLDITRALEYNEATWFDRNMDGERVLAPGTVQLWMNVFTDTPQMAGCCEQSIPNSEDLIARYITAAGFRSETESAEYSLLWMKIFAVHAVAIGGPATHDAYKDFRFPYRFAGRLPLLWSSGDDYIYRVPQRVRGLARVVRLQDVVRHPPANGIDVAEIRPFVAALDDTALPAASWHWNNPDSASAFADMSPNQVFAIALNYDPGWRAFVAGRPVRLRPDGLGLIVVEPHCSGPCAVELRWSPGMEPWIVAFTSLAGLSLAAVWVRRLRSIQLLAV